MYNKFIPQMEPLFGKEEADSINEYMQNVGFITEFKRTQEFEKSIIKYTKSKYCYAVNNGTISLSIAAMALGIKSGDEVLVPNYTMVATPNSIKLLGAKPKFIDVNPDTLWIDFDKALNAVTKKTKAIFLVSANGRYPSESIDDFINALRDKNIAIIEDAAQSLGSFYKDGTHIGLKGDIGSFSFSAPKIISTGQGGALITNNEDLAIKIGKIKDFGRSGGGNDTHDFFGINSKFTELQACIGIEQMKKLPERIQRKKEIWKQYSYLLKNCNSIKLFDNDCSTTAPWFIDCLAKERDQLSKFLKSKNIGSRNMYPPLNNQKIYSDNKNHPVSKKVGDIGLWLPSSVQLSNEEIAYICLCIHEFYSS